MRLILYCMSLFGESRDLNCVVTCSELGCEWRDILGFVSFCQPDLNLLAGGSC